MTNSDHRELKAVEAQRDAVINRIYFLLGEERRRTLTTEERAELARLNLTYNAGR